MQGVANAIYSASQIAPLAIGLALIYAVGRYLNFAHGATYTISAYVALVLASIGLPLVVAATGGVASAGLFGVLTESLLYQRLRRRGSSSLVILLASLGLFIVVQSAIALCFGDSVKILRSHDVAEGYRIFSARLTGIQVIGIVGGLALCTAVWLLLRLSDLGKRIRATANDQDLARTVGIHVTGTNLRVMLIASLLAGFAGIVNGYDVDLRPTMGFQPLLLGVVAMLVGGAGRVGGAILAAIMIAVVQQVAVAHLASQWQDTVVFLILAAVLLFRPYGISRRLGRTAGAA